MEFIGPKGPQGPKGPFSPLYCFSLRVRLESRVEIARGIVRGKHAAIHPQQQNSGEKSGERKSEECAKERNTTDMNTTRSVAAADSDRWLPFISTVYSIKSNEIGLCPFDYKRYILGNSCDTLSYGLTL